MRFIANLKNALCCQRVALRGSSWFSRGSQPRIFISCSRTLVWLLAGLSLPVLPTNAQAPTLPAGHEQSLFAETDLKQAWQAATQAGQPLLVMFTSHRCRYCQKMLSETYGHPSIQQLLAGRAITVLAHSQDYRDLTRKLGVRGYPTSLLISPQGEVLELMPGYIEPHAFAQRIGPLLADPEHRHVAAAPRREEPTAERELCK